MDKPTVNIINTYKFITLQCATGNCIEAVLICNVIQSGPDLVAGQPESCPGRQSVSGGLIRVWNNRKYGSSTLRFQTTKNF